LGMAEDMGAVMAAAMAEVMAGGTAIAKALALELPALSRAPTATATIANVRRVTSLVEDMATGEAMARNTAMAEWRESTATATIANARTGLGSPPRGMDTRGMVVAVEIVDQSKLSQGDPHTNILLFVFSVQFCC